MFHRYIILNTEKSLENTMRSGVFLTTFEVFVYPDETLCRVFDCISSQSKQKLRSKRRSKIVNYNSNEDQVSKPLHGCDFLCFELNESSLMSLRKNISKTFDDKSAKRTTHSIGESLSTMRDAVFDGAAKP